MLSILKRYPWLLLFGAGQIFFSAPGQTFFLSYFIEPLVASTGHSLSLVSGLYSSATVAAALMLVPTGRWLDRWPPKRMIPAICGVMSVGCLLFSAGRSILIIWTAFFLLRWIGQGAFGLSASTLMIKCFKRHRGTAMGLITLGFPLSEFVFPWVGLALIQHIGWRAAYAVLGLFYAIVVLPWQWFVIKQARLPEQDGAVLPVEEWGDEVQPHDGRIKSSRMADDVPVQRVLHDPRFYALVAASCLPPLAVTALFFHQAWVFAYHGWPLTRSAWALMAYAGAKVIGSVAIGPVVDRRGPWGVFAGMILMIAAATGLLALKGPLVTGYLAYAALGAALGFSSPVMNVVWPLIYGTRFIGAIKGVIAMFRNGVTGLGPLPVALLMEAGWGMDRILSVMGIVTVMTALIPIWVGRTHPPSG